MPNASTHIAIGAATGFAVSMLPTNETQKNMDPISSAALGAAFGKLPDVLEPAMNPHHRQFCHSWLIAGSIGYGLFKTYQWQPDDNFGKVMRSLTLVAGGAYLSHLLLDATTPMSLPLVGKL